MRPAAAKRDAKVTWPNGNFLQFSWFHMHGRADFKWHIFQKKFPASVTSARLTKALKFWGWSFECISWRSQPFSKKKLWTCENDQSLNRVFRNFSEVFWKSLQNMAFGTSLLPRDFAKHGAARLLRAGEELFAELNGFVQVPFGLARG